MGTFPPARSVSELVALSLPNPPETVRVSWTFQHHGLLFILFKVLPGMDVQSFENAAFCLIVAHPSYLLLGDVPWCMNTLCSALYNSNKRNVDL